ncbi:hypothetical protein PV325_012351 [Microctonus aethiopoides]|uniref:DPY30 domain-containing protein 2 n=1 Tax=Microctonus aethiopoides TaxID=144406 RepID=A0AA39FR50_9HYME|nr:hypothetical protein PV325_012351 [Microctonus aethiopoides]KAK0097038.1 hypothetical protein PV326_003528 [Microctonus aethiopoides]KAK0173839.1 hypothetical protein PV328_006982 [Microctonus aethiopoides]
MSLTESTKSSRYPLNVAKDKIQQTRDRIRGETSHLNELSQSDDEFNSVLQNDNELVGNSDSHEIDHTSLESLTIDKITIASDNNKELIGNNSEWFHKNLGRPLILGLREIVAKQPRDPVDYLAHWLLNYRSSQVMSKHRRQELTLRRSQLQRLESKKFSTKQAKDECKYQMVNDEEKGELDDWNFENYNMTQIA